MVGHHVAARDGAIFVAAHEVLVQAVAGQCRFAVAALKLPENLIVGAVFLSDEHDVFDRRLVGTGIGRNRVVVVGGHLRETVVVVQHFLGEGGQFGVRRNVHDRHRAFHQTTDVAALRPKRERAAAVRPAAVALGVGHDQLLAIGTHFQLRRKPACGNMAQHFERRHVHNGHGVQSGLGDVEPPLVGRHGYAEGNESAQLAQARFGVEIQRIDYRILLHVDDRHAVVVAVGHENVLIRRHHGIRTAAAHGGEILHHLPDQNARFNLCRNGGFAIL